MEDAGVRPTLYMYQSVLPYIWRDNSMDYVTLMQEKISMALSNLIIIYKKNVLLFFNAIIPLNIIYRVLSLSNLDCPAWTLEARYKSSSSHVLKFLKLSCCKI